AHSTQKVFLRSISHEFRTPLHAVIAGLHSLNASGLDVMQSKIASDIEESCKTLDDLLFKIIDLNEAENGQLQTLNEPFELNRLLNRLVALLEGMAHQYNLDLSVEMSNDIPELALGDQNRLQQALEELIVNIVKLLRNGQLRCRIFARFTFPHQFLLVIDLADTGEPKVTSTLRVLREAFDKIRKSNSLGSVSRRDVGLSLAFRLIKLMNGHVISEEQINRRSNVTLEVPLWIAQRQQDDLPEDIPKLVPKARLKDRRILVVDDNLINLEVGREMFLTAQAEVDVALGGEEAYKMIDRAEPPYDLILLDIHMPGMDGYTLARALRSSMRHRKLKIIGYTASQLYSDREAALRAGMDEVFVKGGEPHRLISLCASQIESGLAA
ncbi:MAG TPA: response regulator, partial [Limnobacter sp.]|uniref:response regulator n=1 Tax=Limnobacter sp. TaxID=2003368 RepID=UPI002E2F18EA